MGCNHERAVRHAMARLAATRFGRAAPLPEIVRAAAAEGVPSDQVPTILERLERQRLAYRRRDGWLPCSPPLAPRRVEALATGAQFTR